MSFGTPQQSPAAPTQPAGPPKDQPGVQSFLSTIVGQTPKVDKQNINGRLDTIDRSTIVDGPGVRKNVILGNKSVLGTL